MPLLHITPSQVDVQLGRALGGMSQDLLEDGRGASGLDPERPCGVAEEVGGISPKERKSRTSKEIRLDN